MDLPNSPSLTISIPALDLTADDFGDRVSQAFVVVRLVGIVAILAGSHQFEKLGWADQAADVGGKNTAGTALHRKRFEL